MSITKRYNSNTTKLRVPRVAQKFKIESRNRFNCLADGELSNSADDTQDAEKDWEKIKKTYQDTAEEVLGFQSRSSKPWISSGS